MLLLRGKAAERFSTERMPSPLSEVLEPWAGFDPVFFFVPLLPPSLPPPPKASDSKDQLIIYCAFCGSWSLCTHRI